MADAQQDIHNEDVNIPKKEGKKLPQYTAALIANITSFVHGAGLGWLSPILPILQSESSPLGTQISNEEGSWLGALICLGAVFGTPLYLFFANRYSRKTTGYLVAVPYIITYVTIIFAKSLPVLYVARFIAGIGTAASTVFCPLYVTEISEDSVRGTLGSLYVLMCYFGILAVYIFGSYTSYNATSYLLLSVTVLYLVAFFFAPETPSYLIKNIKLAAAEKNLIWLRGSDVDIIESEMTKLTSTFRKRKETASSVSFKQMLQSRGTRTGLRMSLLLVANLQLTAPIAILSYTVTIFKDAGSDMSPGMSSIIVAILQIFGTFAATLLLDRAGRKILLTISNLFVTICLALIGVYFFCRSHGIDVTSFVWLPLVCLSTYVVALALGVSPIPFIMIPEMFLPEVREKAVFISQKIMWLIAFIVTKFFTTISDVFGLPTCYWFFALCCFAGFLASVFIYPETKNKSVEKIFEELNSDKKKKKKKVRKELPL